MTRFLQSVLSGLSFGSIYALLAVGFVIIYKSTLVISFAQPGLMVLGGLVAYYGTSILGLPFLVSVAMAMVAAAGLGLIVERSALRPMVGRPVFVAAIITIGVDIVLRIIANRIIGVNARVVQDPWGLDTVQVGGVFLAQRALAIIAITAVLVTALALFFKYSRIGLAMRATALDQETSLAQGISVGAVFAISWAIAAALAAVAGAFVGAGTGLDQGSWVIALKALPAIILGGLDSIPGAVIGGLAVGIVESLFATYQAQYMPWLGSNFSLVSPYVLMLLVLLIRPYGLFGTPEVERV